MSRLQNGRQRVALLVVLATLLVAPYGAGQNDKPTGFDPFSGGTTDLAGTADPAAAALPAVPTAPLIPEIEFNNSDISMAFQIISDATGWSIFPTAEANKAKISVWAKNLTAERLLDMVVTLAGLTSYRQDKVITVMTYDEYAQFHGLRKEVVAFKYANAEAVAAVLRPFLSKLGKSVVHQKTNALVLLESEANLQTIRDVIEKLDVPDDAGAVLEVVDLQYVDAVELAETLQKVFAQAEPARVQTAQAAPDATPDAAAADRITPTAMAPEASVSSPQASVGVFALNRTNQLILKAFQGDIERLRKLVAKLDVYVEPTTRNYRFTYVDAKEIFTGLERTLDLPTRTSGYGRAQGQAGRTTANPCGLTLVEKTNSIVLTAPPSVHRVMTTLVESIDVASTYEAGVIRVYKIENAAVEEVAQAIKDLLQRAEQKEMQPGEPKVKTEVGKAPAEGTGQMELTESEKYVPQVEARVAVSKATNSVIVQATARQHRELAKLVAELDRRRRQVLIESKIVEVTTSDSLNLGVELSYAGRDGFSFSQFGLSTNLDPKTGARDIIVSPGGAAAVLRPDHVQGLLQALQSNQHARVTSAPRVLVNDNAVGLINSVAEEPYTQVNQGQNTDTVSFGGFVEAGTQFMITPHISESGYLRVEYQITLNSFAKKATEASVPPPRNTSNIRSEATVPNGHTIIVGGLQTSDVQKVTDKVPLLGDIPLVGLLFQNTSTRKTYKTTYLFITPIIMQQQDFSDLKDVSDQTVEEADVNEHEEKP
jgi:type II secretory pathway component GspD/PulD (secretin)